MKTNLLMFFGLLILSSQISFNCYTQESAIKERYIKIENIESSFILNDDNNTVSLKSFELYNIYENESSKPIFVAVNEINNVVKFNIKSESEQFENVRTCYLTIQSLNHLNTFYVVLQKMEVKYIFTNNQFIKLDDYFSKLI
jgi:hypothetical protein